MTPTERSRNDWEDTYLCHLSRLTTPARSSELDADVLGLQVLLDAFRAALAAEAGGLHAAERGGRVRDDPLVDSNHACLQAFGNGQCAGEVLGEGICDE